MLPDEANKENDDANSEDENIKGIDRKNCNEENV